MKYSYLFIFLLLAINSYGQEDTQQLIVTGINAMYEKEYETSLELLTKAKAQAEESNNAEQLFLAINNIGANYYSMLDYGEALDNYLEAYTIAIKDLEPFHEMIVLNNIAILYSKDKKYDKAEEYFSKALTLAKNNNESIKQGLYSINLGQVDNEQGDLISAENYLNKAIELVKEYPRLLIEAQLELANNHYLKGDYPKAKRLSFELIGQLDGIEYREHKIGVLLLLSKTYLKEKDNLKAEEFARKALKEDLNIENKIEVYNQLSSIYMDSSLYEQAVIIKDSLLIFQNELSHIKNGRLYETNKVKFEIQNYQKELKDQQDKITAQQKTFYTVLLSAIIIILLIGWALRNSYRSIKQRKVLHQRSEEIMGLEIEKERTENLLLEKQLKEKETQLLLEQEQLKSEIESKNRKLSAKALFLTDRNKLVKTLIRDLETSDNAKGQLVLNDHIRNLKGFLRTDTEWDSFVTHFEDVNQGFLNNLKQKHSSLNANDIRFISYLYMNLSLKEISSILNITPEACRKRKERVSKKLELKESTQLYSYISRV